MIGKLFITLVGAAFLSATVGATAELVRASALEATAVALRSRAVLWQKRAPESLKLYPKDDSTNDQTFALFKARLLTAAENGDLSTLRDALGQL